ncbi:hypothetical protein HGB07_01595 [Candidatus Roizmanbacteria bacterium]|nr:hypothetical protein [Candidatus Roizmanbacteria bacterium]
MKNLHNDFMFPTRRIVFFLFAGFIILTPCVQATDMDSNIYHIQYGNVNIGARSESSSNYKISTTMGQTAAQSFNSNGYYVKAGFQYWHNIIPFRFSVSNTNLNFGVLTPGTPATINTTLTVSFGAAGNYQVTAIEEGKLRTMAGYYIPDTNCDGGTCTTSSAAIWNSNSTYGFGYTMTGQDIPTDFIDSTYFRPLPDRSASANPAVVMYSTNVGRSRQATMMVKTNVSATQAAGSYQTVINFAAIPTY